MASDPENALNDKLESSLHVFADAVSTTGFYVEWLLIGASLALSIVLTWLLRKYVRRALHEHPIRAIDPHVLIRATLLAIPLLTFLFLSVTKPIALKYGQEAIWLASAMQMSLTIAVATLVVQVVRNRMVAYLVAGVILIIQLLDVTGLLATTSASLEAITFSTGKFKISMLDFMRGMVMLVVVFWAAGKITRTLESYLRRSSSLSYSARELIVKFFTIFIYFVAFITTLSFMGVDLTLFAVFGGALGVGIGLGLQKVTANFVSGITLLLEKSIKIGDLIEIGGNSGWVRALNIRYALVETSDGRELLVPNEELTSTRVTNWTHSNEHARIEIKVVVDYASDPKQVIALMLQCARAHPRCLKRPEPLCWLREFGEFGLVFLLTFWIPDVHEGRNGPQSDVMTNVIAAFQEVGIRFAERKV